MLIVDSQIHIWQNGKMSAHHRQIPTYSVDDALAEMKSAGVDCAVIHPPSSLGEPVNVLAVDAARRYPDKFCILGHFDLQSPDREQIVARWRERPGMLGFRFTFNQPQQKAWWTDGSLDWFWAACEKGGYPVGLLAGGQMPALAKIAERHPRLKLHIDHLGRHGGGTGLDRRRGVCRPERHAGAREVPERRDQDVGRAELFEPAVSVQEHPRLSPTDLRGVRSGSVVLGDRHHAHAVLVSAVRDDVHRGAAVAEGPRPRAGDGRRRRRLARVEAPRRVIRHASRVLVAALVWVVPTLAFGAPEHDGNYTGYITCDMIPGQTATSLRTEFSLTIAGDRIEYQREVLRPEDAARMGVTERGRGSVSPAGEVLLRGSAIGSGFSFDSSYRGQISGRVLHLQGSQFWQLARRPPHSRPCTIALSRSG